MARSIGQTVIAAPRQLSSVSGISQDNIIFAMILLSFIIWITSKGELPTYIAFFKPGNIGLPLDLITATSSTGTNTGQTSTPTNPNTGTVVAAGNGQPGLNLNNPFAGIPILGGAFQTLLPGNSNGSATQQVPGQANPIPFGQIGTFLRNLL
jgi:hypothetical protein